MIHFLDLKKFTKGLRPITTTLFFSKEPEFHPEGLFSEIIFGPLESKDRLTTFSYIDLNAKVIHPTAYNLLTKRLERKVLMFVSAQDTFSLDKNGALQQDPDGVTGIRNFIELFPKINFRGGSEERVKLIKRLKEIHKEGNLFIDVIPVLPPQQRDIYEDKSGRWIWDPINDVYLNILRRTLQLKATAKGPLFDLLNYELQKAVMEHDEFVRVKVQKKSGLIRSQLLGKRTDFSARAVITPGPDLKANEIGIPLRIAVSLFEPFLIHRLLNSGRVDTKKLESEIKKFLDLELSVDSVRAVFKSIKSGDKVPETLYNMIFEAAEVVSMNRAVLAKRDPVLHAEGVRAFKVKIVRGVTVRICALQVGGFNADFDGDTMAIYHPVTNEAQEEMKTKMMRSEGGETPTSVNFGLSKEMCAGLFIMTKNIKKAKSPLAVTKKDFETATDPYIPVTYKGKQTTLGRAMFNDALPPDYPFQDKTVDKKFANSLIPIIIEKYGQDVAVNVFHRLQTLGFKFATIMSPSIILEDFQLPSEILQLKKQLKNSSTEEADIIIKKAQKLLIKHLKDKGIYDLVESGAGKGWGQPTQMLFAKGLVSDPNGKVMEPIVSSYTDGLTNKDYYTASAGARKGIIDRVLNTAETGYTARQLAYILNSVEIDRTLKDCKTKRTLNQRLIKSLIGRLTGRYVVENDKVVKYEQSNYKVGDVVQLRSPILCESPKICHTCYGDLFYRHKTPYAGILAAQIVGEAGTQTIMKTFHTGGAVEIVEKDILGDIVQNDPFTNKNTVIKTFMQQSNTLIAKKDFQLTLNKSDYPLPQDIQEDENTGELLLKALIGKAEFDDVIIQLILDYPVKLTVYEREDIEKNTIQLQYSKDSTILETPLETHDLKNQLQYVKRLLGGKEIYSGADHLYRKFFKVYAPLTGCDSVHFEVLLSHVMRDKSNQSIPARLGKKFDPVLMNIKDIVFKTSFIQGLAFENINKAISTGLITDEPVQPSILEQVMTGTLAKEKK
jgi:DNA-directed RNA polymerase subunit beta'